MPLPILTHLPVHVNATFALTDNRRDLWLGEGIKLFNYFFKIKVLLLNYGFIDMRGEAKKRSDWNYNLLEEVVAPAYIHTLLEVSKAFAGTTYKGQSGETCADYYSIWPSWHNTNRDNAWGFLTRKFYDQIGTHPAFSSEPKSGVKFLTLLPPTVVLSFQTRSAYPDLEGLLLDSGVSITSPPKPILETLEKFKKPVQMLLPSFARKVAPNIIPILSSVNPTVFFFFFFSFLFLLCFLN